MVMCWKANEPRSNFGSQSRDRVAKAEVVNLSTREAVATIHNIKKHPTIQELLFASDPIPPQFRSCVHNTLKFLPHNNLQSLWQPCSPALPSPLPKPPPSPPPLPEPLLPPAPPPPSLASPFAQSPWRPLIKAPSPSPTRSGAPSLAPSSSASCAKRAPSTLELASTTRRKMKECTSVQAAAHRSTSPLPSSTPAVAGPLSSRAFLVPSTKLVMWMGVAWR